MNEIVSGNVLLYAHSTIIDGVENGLWEKVGHSDEIGDLSHVLFKDPGCDFRQRISETWSVWHINELPHRYIGKMTDEYRHAIPGDIIPCDLLKFGIESGCLSYCREYPEYKRQRVCLRLGDVFCVPINDSHNRFFQYIGTDSSQLNSEMIRVFKTSYVADNIPPVSKIINDEIDFYAHSVIRFGVNYGYWYKIGNSKEIGDYNDILFISSGGIEPINGIYPRCDIWHPNGIRLKFENGLPNKYRHVDYGSVMPWYIIASRIRYGRSLYKSPTFKVEQ